MGRNADGQRKDEPSSGRVLHGSTGQAGDSYAVSFRRRAATDGLSSATPMIAATLATI